MVQFRRKNLDSLHPEKSTNAGLWLDKYLRGDEKIKDEDPKKILIDEVIKIELSKAYKKFYQKWKSELNNRGIQPKEAKTLGRLAVNLGSESTLENSIALIRTYGVPYIPGSALKGLAAHYARTSLEGWSDKTQAYKDIFGEQDNAGYVNFYDALYIPDGKLGLVPDVVTVHHQEYYQKDGVPPADWDSPIPIPFLSVSGSFLIALSGPKSLVEAAYKILFYVLLNEGIGAKTNSGYGRMKIEGFEAESGSGAQPAAASAPLAPPKGAIWKKGKISNDGKSVQPADASTQKLYFHHEHVLPKGYTPAQKSEVEYLEERLADGSSHVWVKKLYYSVD